MYKYQFVSFYLSKGYVKIVTGYHRNSKKPRKSHRLKNRKVYILRPEEVNSMRLKLQNEGFNINDYDKKINCKEGQNAYN